MSKQPASFQWLYALLLVIALAVVAGGTYVAITQHIWTLLAAGALSVVGVLISWPIAMQLYASHTFTCANAEKTWSDVNDRLEQFSVMLNLISEQQLISDRAKSVAFRDKDADALRRAIQDEILHQHWEAAGTLIGEMERQFGFRQEAEDLRAQISDVHNDRIRKLMTESTNSIDRFIRAESWTEAQREAARISAVLPNHAPAVNMPAEVENRREVHKRSLITGWNDAVARHDIDGAIELLRRMDGYLTPSEAAPFQEKAREIVKEKLHMYRAQLTGAVQNQKWAEAQRLAESVIRDFPNTQMAREAEEVMESLRNLAAGKQAATV